MAMVFRRPQHVLPKPSERSGCHQIPNTPSAFTALRADDRSQQSCIERDPISYHVYSARRSSIAAAFALLRRAGLAGPGCVSHRGPF